jgi:hypothetical protein
MGESTLLKETLVRRSLIGFRTSSSRGKETLMILPDHVFAVVRALHAANLTLIQGDDDARRRLQQKIVETAVARFPGEGWGWKKADNGRPPSKDAIANNKIVPGHLLAWDCFDGGTREPAQREGETIDGQVFIEIVGVDHLAGQTIPVHVESASPKIAAKLPAADEFLSTLNWINTLYKEQLGRQGVDLEGIAAHVFGTYLNARLQGTSAQDAKGAVVARINAILNRTDIHV